MKLFSHFLLTRFDVRLEGMQRPTKAWVEHRLALFERFCLPSVAEQSSRDFNWIICFGSDFGEIVGPRLRAIARHVPLRPLYFSGPFRRTYVRDLVKRLSHQTPFVITTRLDNDDAICSDFMQSVQNSFTGQAGIALNFPNGFAWCEGKVFDNILRSNPFVSLVENRGSCETVWFYRHTEIGRAAELRQVEHRGAWLRVIHNRNLASRPVGIETLSTAGLHNFPSHLRPR